MKNSEKIPSFIYGTAWKEERTSELTKQAVFAGFKAIDTANQKKHYQEDEVGKALLELAQQGIQRESLFIQTKFTYVQGQDHRMPYNPSDPISAQVRSSFASSLGNLHTDYVDSYLLHGPSSPLGLVEADREVWRTMEDLHRKGQAKMIGVSNVEIHHLKALSHKCQFKPMIVQNRCYASRGWDKSVREYCLENDIIYQGFSLLTANRHVLADPQVQKIAKRLETTPQQVIFRFAKQIGILPITGTTNQERMVADLSIYQFELSPYDVELLISISF